MLKTQMTSDGSDVRRNVNYFKRWPSQLNGQCDF